MSGAKNSAIDVMTAEDTALLDSMRNETDAPEIVEEIVEAIEPELDEPEIEEAVAAADPAEPGQKPQSRTAKRIQELTEKARVADAARIAAEQARAVSEGVVTERLRLLTEAANAAMQPAPVAAPAPPPIEIPPIDTDPVGHFRALFEQQQRTNSEQAAILSGFAEQQRQNQDAQALQNWGRASEAEFATKEPAYQEAIQFMVERRKMQLSAIGITDAAAQEQVMRSDINQIAMKTRAEGGNLGERFYKVAEAFGFQKKAPEAAASAAPVIPPLEAGLPAADRATRAETGRANSTTIANVGAATPLAVSVERVANMSEADFAKYVDNVRAKGGSALRDLLGH